MGQAGPLKDKVMNKELIKNPEAILDTGGVLRCNVHQSSHSIPAEAGKPIIEMKFAFNKTNSSLEFMVSAKLV